MPLPPITVQLSKFEQIEIVRDEIEAREAELKHVEAKLRELLYDVEKRRYLQSLHGFFQELQPHEELSHYQALSDRRENLAAALEMLRAAMTQLEQETAGHVAPPRPAGSSGLQRPTGGAGAGAAGAPGAARRRFDSFDDFRSAQPRSGQ